MHRRVKERKSFTPSTKKKLVQSSSTRSDYEDRLEFYANFLVNFREQRSKLTSEIPTVFQPKISSNRGIFSASPPKLSNQRPNINIKKLLSVANQSAQSVPAAVHAIKPVHHDLGRERPVKRKLSF